MKLLDEGISLFNAGRYAEAAKLFERAVAEGGGEQARFCLEHALKSLERPRIPSAPQPGLGDRLAKEDVRGKAKLLDEVFEADVNLGYRLARDAFLNLPLEGRTGGRWGAFFEASRHWRADRSVEALENLSRSHVWARYYTAEILLRRLDLFELARVQIDRVLKECTWLWEARCLRAEILLALGSAEGLEPLRTLEVPESSRPAFLAWRGALNLWWGTPDLAALDEAVSLSNPDALCWRGGSLVLLGRLKEGLADLDKLLAMDPNDPEALTWRGEALRRLGSSEAKAALDRAVEAQHDPLWAAVNRMLLEGPDNGDAGRLAPPVYADAPDGGPIGGERGWAKLKLTRELLEEALRLARGCRRSDTHLNVMWQRAAGVPVPKRPTPHARLVYWLRSRGVDCPPELVFGPGSVSEAAARQAIRLPKAISGATGSGFARKRRASR